LQTKEEFEDLEFLNADEAVEYLLNRIDG